jgi:ParB-like chromosome segregation protein Spo0J
MTKKSEITNETAQKHFEVDVRNIKPLNKAGGNLRNDYGEKDGSFDELVANIKENGIIMPLRAFRDNEAEGGWIAIDGHTRLKAAMVLVEQGITVRAKVITVDRKKISDEQLIVDMVVANSGRQLNPLELSEAVRRLRVVSGWSAKDIAVKFSMPIYAIKNLELLGSAPKRFRDMIANGTISSSVAMRCLRTTKDYNDAIETLEKAAGIAKVSAKQQTPASDSEDGEDKTEPTTRITNKHLNDAINKVDFAFELKQVFKRQLDNQKEVKNQVLFSFCKKLVEGKITASDIERELFN